MTAPAHVRRLTALIAADQAGRRMMMSVPGCWDAITALLIERAGFDAAFLSGGALSMARLGQPDMGLVTASETIDTIALIRDRVALPLIVDGDTGFGNAVNLQRTVRAFERAGASAIQIEDQGFPKRCGHMAGKTVVPIGEAVGRISAALDARHDMLVVARTDALAIEGVDAAIERAEAFRAAGADMIFIEGPRDRRELDRIAERFARHVPLVHNLVEGGVTPTRDGKVLADLGFAIALHPLLLLHGLTAQAPDWLGVLARDRSTEALGDRIADLVTMNEMLGAPALIETGKTFDG